MDIVKTYMTKEVEILKIGSIMPILPITGKKGSRVYDTSQFSKQTIMVVFNAGPIFDYYVEVLKEKCGDKYKYLKTDQTIVGTIEIGSFSKTKVDIMKGIQHDEPKIGSSYGVSHWYTSTVNDIIDGNILITKNSVYAIHDISKIRDKKLKDLGI